jgi:hypothetical protein
VTTSIEPIQLALDQNFPEPILSMVAPYLPEVAFIPLRDIDPTLPKLDDREMLITLHQRGVPGLVTNNYKMLNTPKELAAILRTKVMVFAVEGVGHDPVRAAGAVLLDLPAPSRSGRSASRPLSGSSRGTLKPTTRGSSSSPSRHERTRMLQPSTRRSR